jgi:hypothetical protein
MIARTLDPKFPSSILKEKYWSTPDRFSVLPVAAVFMAILVVECPQKPVSEPDYNVKCFDNGVHNLAKEP